MTTAAVALLAEGVDRNDNMYDGYLLARVALLAEGVDRNKEPHHIGIIQRASPSSRRAWIEISGNSKNGSPALVALLAEGVDRNTREDAARAAQNSRPPRGGRG